jgi:hypothetical protein
VLNGFPPVFEQFVSHLQIIKKLPMKRLLLLSLVSLASIFSDGQSLQLRLPTKGDVWPIYSMQKIQWQYANVDNIKIEVSTDSARSWSVIQSSYPASATFFDWTVTNNVSDSCYLRITDVANPSVYSTSHPNNSFKIPKPVLKIDNIETPVFAKAALPISWTAEGTQSIRLMASFDENRSYQLIADNIPASAGFYNWLVKDTAAANCFILIISKDNALVSDTIEQPFSIKKLPLGDATKYKGGSYDGHTSATNKVKSLTLLSPNRKEQFAGNTVYPITWSSTSIPKVDLLYSIDSGVTWVNIATGVDANVSLFNWTVPPSTTAKGLIKISDASDPAVYDLSDSTFTIKPNSLKLTSPAENEITFKGQVLPISWSSTGVSKINISYLEQSTWKTIVSGINASNEVFNWPVLANLPDSIRIKIADYDNPLISDTISNILLRKIPSIIAAKYNGGSYDGHSSATNKRPFLTLTTPNGGEEVASAVSFNIAWTSGSVAKVDIRHSVDSGSTWQNVVSSWPNTGSFLWRVPGLASSKCLIKIESSDDSTVTDISNGTFTILAKSINLVSMPKTLYLGTSFPIEWTQLGIEKVNLNYKTSRNGIWQKIKDSVVSTAEVYNWIVPQITGDSLWIRVFDYTDSMVADEQPLPMVLKRLPAVSHDKFKGGHFDGHSSRSTNNKISIFKPSAADTLKTGNTYPISWIPGNVTDSIMLQFSADSGRTWKSISQLPAAAGQYEWSVPIDVSHRNSNVNSRTTSEILLTNCMVRAVEINSGSEIVGITNKTFSIIQSVPLAPNTISFKGDYLATKQVILKWVAENETNLDRYEVERSVDGSAYHKVKEVKATNAASYTFTDDVKDLSGQKVSYRLTKVDSDGNTSYSSILYFDVPANIRFNVFPNPAKTYIQLQVKSNLSGLIRVQLVDLTGRIVLQKIVDAATTNIRFLTSDLRSGIYFVKIKCDEAEYFQKIIVTK